MRGKLPGGVTNETLRFGTFPMTSYPFEGSVTVDNMGVYRVVNPISGETLVITDISKVFRDPLSGAYLKVRDGKVLVVTPMQHQKLNRSRLFGVLSEPDVGIQTQRQTIHFNRKTNEKVCASGMTVGLDSNVTVEFGKRKAAAAPQDPIRAQGGQ